MTAAERLARAAHEGQREKFTREPYVNHLERVVALVAKHRDEDVTAAAWLHDVLEDTDVTLGELEEQGIAERVVEAVILLTRVFPYNSRDFYQRYVENIIASGNRIALLVKHADLVDHLREFSQQYKMPREMRQRYKIALQSIERAL